MTAMRPELRLTALCCLLLPCALHSLAARADAEFTCPQGTRVDGAAPPAGLELRCLDSENRAEGIWRTWYDNGQLMSERSMKQGREHGRQRSWWPNGQLMMDGISYEGTRVKGFRFWSITGQPNTLSQQPQQSAPAPADGALRL